METISGILTTGKPYELRYPTLGDLSRIETYQLTNKEAGNIQLAILYISTLCTKWGDQSCVTREELEQLSSRELGGLSNTLDQFQL